MGKGFSLIEMLIAIVILAAILLGMVPAFTTLISDIPRSHRVAQANTSLLNMLEHLHKDIDAAEGLPQSFAGHTANDRLLLIESADDVLAYQLKPGQVLRRSLKYPQQAGGEGATAWPIPNAGVEWHVWKKGNKGYALEVKTHVGCNVGGRMEKKMANSHLYFVGAFREVSK